MNNIPKMKFSKRYTEAIRKQNDREELFIMKYIIVSLSLALCGYIAFIYKSKYKQDDVDKNEGG